MATTFQQVQYRVRSHLMGFSLDQDQVSQLSIAMNASDTSFTVDAATANNISRGLCQIDDELILVKQVDLTSGLVTVMGGVNGRGREGSVAASHSVNALVTNSPMFPNIRVQEAINDTLQGTYPDLVAFGTTNLSKLAPVVEYELPSECLDVWYLTGQLVGPSKVWQPLMNWRYNPKADTTTFPSGKTIQVLDAVVPGRQMRVTYAKKINQLVNASDDFESVSGLPERCVDMIVYGAVSRLLPAYEAARLQQRAIESNQRSTLVPPSSSTRTAQYYASLYQQRLQDERARMYTEIPNYQQYQGS